MGCVKMRAPRPSQRRQRERLAVARDCTDGKGAGGALYTYSRRGWAHARALWLLVEN